VPKRPVTNGPRGPGLAKAGRHALVSRRRLELWHACDYGWRELFERADVMSEGAVRDDRDGRCYFGTTSILLPYVSRGGLVPDELARAMTRLAGRDPHARVRAMRIAYREAHVRASVPLERMHTEVVVRPDSRGIRVDVEVEARIAHSRSEAARTRKRRAAGS
jgi:hypothetical protein